MALMTRIYDADTIEARPVRWGWWHILVITDLARREGGFPDDMPILEVWSLNGGKHEVQYETWYKDYSDDEVFVLRPGDQIEVWRDR
jgi:hypothetical protein